MSTEIQIFHAGEIIRIGIVRYVVLGPIEDYALYVEGERVGVNDTPVKRRHLPVVRLPDVPQFIDQSVFYSVSKEPRHEH